MAMYYVCLSDDTLFTDVSDTTMLQMMEKLDVSSVGNSDTGELLYLKRNKSADKVGGITKATTLPYMVIQSFIHPNGVVEDFVMNNQPESDAKSWFSIDPHDPELAKFNEDMGMLLSAVSVFQKDSDGYEFVGRIDF